LLAFALPGLGVGTLFFLLSMFLLPFASEVLGTGTALLSGFILLARLWDGISDPLAGHYSDRTRSRLGRRRPWMLAAIVPIAFASWMLWVPPPALGGRALELWLGAWVIAFYTATTLFYVPYQSLGAELSPDPHETTRVFSGMVAGQVSGTLVAAVLGTWVMEQAAVPRDAAGRMTLGLAAFTAVAIGFAVWRLREHASYERAHGAKRLFSAFRDVWRNPHARVVYLATGIDNLGTASLATLAFFYAKYILDAAEQTPLFLVFNVVPGLAVIPLVHRMAARFGKVPVWRVALCVQSLGFVGLSLLQPGQMALAFLAVATVSLGGTSGQVLAPSVMSDVVDSDELTSGERKEGAFYALRNLTFKLAFGLGAVAVGLMLEWTGFVPGAPLGRGTEFGMRTLMGGTPALGALVAVFVLGHYRLGPLEHARVLAQLAQRARDAD